MTRFDTFENEDERLEDWWRVLEVNLRGTLSFIRAMLPAMREKGSGVLISLASTSDSQDIPFNTAYACSKAAVIKFNQNLGIELEGSGVYCYALHPGTVDTHLGSKEGAVNTAAMSASEGMKDVFAKFCANE